MSNEIAVNFTVDEQEIKLTQKIVSEYLAGGAQITMPEFKMFSSLCQARGLNPFLKEAYIIKYGNAAAQIVVGKDAILKRAILNKNFNGREQGVIVIDKNGDVVEKKGTFVLSDETLAGGWAKVYRKDWDFPVYITVSFEECAQRKRDGQLNQQWATKSATMIEKVALIRALREAFVENVGGMYEAEELPEVAVKQNEIVEDAVIIQDEPVIKTENSDDVDISDL